MTIDATPGVRCHAFLKNQQETCVLTAKSSALSPFDLASACLGVVRRRAGGSQAERSRLPGARNRRRLGVNRQQSGGCRIIPKAPLADSWGIPPTQFC
jgi:hypothetical protein